MMDIATLFLMLVFEITITDLESVKALKTYSSRL